MRRSVFIIMAMVLLGAVWQVHPAKAAPLGQYEVYGVEEGDMLKMRGGPGTGFSVIVGLPNGTVLRVHSCQQTGSTRWCRVSLQQARGLKGYVSWAYLRKI